MNFSPKCPQNKTSLASSRQNIVKILITGYSTTCDKKLTLTQKSLDYVFHHCGIMFQTITQYNRVPASEADAFRGV